jgi:hypothetical protein
LCKFVDEGGLLDGTAPDMIDKSETVDVSEGGKKKRIHTRSQIYILEAGHMNVRIVDQRCEHHLCTKTK